MKDASYWAEKVRHPAAAWTAAGGRGAPTVATAAAVLNVLPGGSEAKSMETDDKAERRRQRNQGRRQANKRRRAQDREELQRLRSQPHTGPDTKGGKSKGKGKSKEQRDLLQLGERLRGVRRDPSGRRVLGSREGEENRRGCRQVVLGRRTARTRTRLTTRAIHAGNPSGQELQAPVDADDPREPLRGGHPAHPGEAGAAGAMLNESGLNAADQYVHEAKLARVERG